MKPPSPNWSSTAKTSKTRPSSSPPDAARLIIKTNFNKTVTKRHVIDLDDLAVPEHFEKLRQLFHDPEKLRPQETTDQATKSVANLVGIIADNIRSRGYPDTVIARFMDRVVFCMFAEDVGLLPAKIFSTLLGKHLQDATGFDTKLLALFRAMASGGYLRQATPVDSLQSGSEVSTTPRSSS